MHNDLLLKYTHEDEIHSVIIEDDGRVAYAYLLEGDDIISDVWLYNRCNTPDTPPWNSEGAEMPFANPSGFALETRFVPPSEPAEISVVWEGEDKCHSLSARVLIREELHAILRKDVKPGRCRLAGKDGPVAKALNNKD
jgi:hypothetical protein